MKAFRAPLLSVLLACIGGAALAHTPFVRPDNFSIDAPPVTAEAGYGEEVLSSHVGLPARGLAVIAPNGERQGYDRIVVDPNVTRLAATFDQEGTYRLTTGEQLSGVSRMVLDHGQWRELAQGERIRGRRTSTLQLVMLADAYVTRGAPTRPSVDMTIGRLAIRPVTHPNEIHASSGFDVDLLFDGAPFAYMPFVLYTPGQSEEDMRRVFVTDENGRAHITFEHPGVYLAVVRYRTPAPRGAGAAVRSYSTSITFEALPDSTTP